MDVPVSFDVADVGLGDGDGFGALKNEVMLPLAFGFLDASRGSALALRFRDMMSGRMRCIEDSLDACAVFWRIGVGVLWEEEIEG